MSYETAYVLNPRRQRHIALVGGNRPKTVERISTLSYFGIHADGCEEKMTWNRRRLNGGALPTLSTSRLVAGSMVFKFPHPGYCSESAERSLEAVGALSGEGHALVANRWFPLVLNTSWISARDVESELSGRISGGYYYNAASIRTNRKIDHVIQVLFEDENDVIFGRMALS